MEGKDLTRVLFDAILRVVREYRGSRSLPEGQPQFALIVIAPDGDLKAVLMQYAKESISFGDIKALYSSVPDEN